jgi:hypothetical protein
LVAATVKKIGLGFSVTLTVFALAGCSDSQMRSSINLADSFTGDQVEASPPFDGARESTEETCAVISCEQAVTTDHFVLVKFSSDEEAAQYAKSLSSNGTQVDPMVIDFTGSDLTPIERTDVIKSVAGVNASSNDE